MTKNTMRWLSAIAPVVALMAGPAAAQRSWDDNGNDASKEWSIAANWNPNGSPVGQPITIGDLANAADDTTIVDFDSLSLFTIDSLTVSNGADVDTNGNQLWVNGVTAIGGAGVSIIVRPRSAGDQDGLDSQGIVVNAGAALKLAGELGSTRGGIVELQSGLFEINTGGAAGGHGTIELIEPAAGQVMENSGRLYVTGRPDPNVGSVAGTLTITHDDSGTSASGTGTLDLDGDNEAGLVDVDDGFELFVSTSLTLAVEVPLADNFSGQMDIGHNDTVNMVHAWTMDGNGILNFDGASTLSGGTLTVNGATTRVNINGGTALFQNNLTFTDGDFRFGTGTVQFDGTTTFPDASDLLIDFFFDDLHPDAMIVNSLVNIGDLIVEADEDFNWDQAGPTTVNAAGDLNIHVENIRLGNSDTYAARLTMNSGNVDVRVADGVWVMDGVLNINNSAADSPLLSGDAIEIGGDSVALSADVNVGGIGVSQISAPITFQSDADVSVAAGAILVTGAATFESVNGSNNAEFTGTGTWRLAGLNTVSETTTINMAGGTVDLDNSAVTASIANNTHVNAPLTINAATMADYGSAKTFQMNTTLSNLNIDHLGAETGTLTVNLDDPAGEWTLSSSGVMNLINDNVAATLLAGSDVNLNGTVNVTGDVRTTARVDFGSTAVVNINTATQPLRLNGGNNTNDPNTIAGGLVSGPGVLAADIGRSLHGFGTINTNIDFSDASDLRADNGTLHVTASIADARTVGTADGDGVLNIVNAWNSNVVANVSLLGGELRGGTITVNNATGISGHGLVSAPVVNNTRIDADGGSLIVQTAANDNDWDGADGTGQLNAITGDLEIRDNEPFHFTGTMNVGPRRTVFAHDFVLYFDPGSTLSLTNGTYRAQIIPFGAGIFGGSIIVNPGGPSTLEVIAEAEFVNLSTTTLNDDLMLFKTLAVIRVGADFAGDGALVILPQSNLLIEDGVVSGDLGVLIRNLGSMGLGVPLSSAGQVSAVAFQQEASGGYGVDLGGTGLSDFDRLSLTDTASLDGRLSIQLTGYVPMLGDTFDILSAAGGVIGSFAEIRQPHNMPAALKFDAIYSPTLVQLMVVPELLGDYNRSGVVDAADYTLWRDTLGAIVSVFSGADGDGNGTIDQDDYAVWRAHFGQTAGIGAAASANAAVPEPATLVLLLLGALPMCIGRRATVS